MKPRILKDAIWLLFHLVVASFALLLVIGAFVPRSFAQTTSESLLDTQRRITILEGLNLDHRLTVIETLLNDVKEDGLWHKLATGGTGLLLGERVIWALKKKTDKEEKDND